MKFMKKRNDIFLNFLISYIAILIIPLLIGYFAYQKAFTVVENEEKYNALSSLEMAKSVADSYVSGIERMVTQISTNKELNEILYKENISNYSMKLFLESMKSYFTVNDKYSRYYIVLKNSSYVITPETAFQNDFFFKSIFKYGNLSSDQIQSKLLSEYIKGEYWPETAVIHEGGTQKAITYIHSIPLNYNNRSEGVILSVIDTSKFKELLSGIDVNDGSFGYITDKDNNILTSVGLDKQSVKALQIDGKQGFMEYSSSSEKMLAVYTTSSENGWRYVAVIPKNIIMQKVNGIKALTLLIMAISLLLGIIIAFLMSYRNVRPIKSMVKMLSDITGNDIKKNNNDIEFIKGNISSLAHNNKYLQNILKDQVSLVKTAFLDRLVKGEFYSKEELEAITRYIGLELNNKKYIIIVISLYAFNELPNEEIIKEMNITKILVKDTISSVLDNNVLINEISENKLILLVSMNDDGSSTGGFAEKSFTEIFDKIEEKCKIKPHIAFGEVYDDLLYTNQSYEEAARALEYSLNTCDNYIIWFHDIPKHSDSFYYPLEQESRLMNIVKSGNFNELKQLMDSNYNENFVNRRLTPHMSDSLLLALWVTAVKLNIQLQLDCIPVNGETFIHEIKSAEQGYMFLLNIFRKMCNAVIELKQNKNLSLKNNILEYIDTEYTDSNISLTSIASEFGLTEAYVSYFFKDQTGENFINYLTDKRIKLACELLKSTSQSVSEVASKVGYNSDQVFRRAFKRKMELGPAEFRNKEKEAVAK